jgi:hypothetical protein
VELESITHAADFTEQFKATLPPLLIVRWSALSLATARKNHIADFQVRDGSAVRRGLRVQLPGEPQRTFPHLESRPTVTDDRGKQSPIMNHHRVVTDVGRKLVVRSEDIDRNDNKRIVVRDQKTTGLEIIDPPFEILDSLA